MYHFKEQFNTRDVVLLFGIIISFFVEKATTNDYEYYYDEFNDKGTNRLPCHMDTKTKDLLQSIDEFTPDDNSIFFHETSCNGYLNARQACSIEAAALAHIHRQVYVLFNAPITNLTNLRLLNLIPNVHCVRIHANYSKDIVGNKTLNKLYFESEFPIRHAADIFRFATMYRWGGTYLDMDMIVIKPLDELERNWVTAECHDELSIGAMNFAHDEIGMHAVEMVLNEIKESYNGIEFKYNGNGALTRTFLKLCNMSDKNFFKTDCKGFNIYNSSYFYPIPFARAEKYFLRNHDFRSAAFHQAYAHHTWNFLTGSMKIEDGSLYSHLATMFCPNIYTVYREELGNRSLIN